MDVLVLDDKEGVDAVNLFAMSGWDGDNAFEDSTKVIGSGLIPYDMEFGMIAELAIFKGLDVFFVEDEGPVW